MRFGLATGLMLATACSDPPVEKGCSSPRGTLRGPPLPGKCREVLALNLNQGDEFRD